MSLLPLQNIMVLEFSQYLSGPSAGLRLSDLGARVVKIERPLTGDACRALSIKNMWVGNDSLLFHTINRGKESVTADLKNPEDQELVYALLKQADVLTHNFRPGVMEKIGLDYEKVKSINPKLIYASISGYGTTGPWKHKPGQDLLVQSLSGLTHTTGLKHQNPVPFGLSIADYLCGAQLVQGILAGLIHREYTGEGVHIEVSLFETILDFQFELLTTYFSGGDLPERSARENGHPLLSAPYGIYPVRDGYIAIAMMPIHQLAETIGCDALLDIPQADAFRRRDEIKSILCAFLLQQDAQYWMGLLRAADLWAIEVHSWQQLMQQEGYQLLEMEQNVDLPEGGLFKTTRCPIRWNGTKIFSSKSAPLLGEHNEKILRELNLWRSSGKIQLTEVL